MRRKSEIFLVFGLVSFIIW